MFLRYIGAMFTRDCLENALQLLECLTFVNEIFGELFRWQDENGLPEWDRFAIFVEPLFILFIVFLVLFCSFNRLLFFCDATIFCEPYRLYLCCLDVFLLVL